MKPVCVQCRRFYRIEKTGYYFTEMMPKGNGAAAGKREPEKWQPYKLWAGDLWACPDCGAEIVVGTGRHPIAEHYQPDFVERVVQLGADELQVNDC